jgi:hypothetical protein
MANAIITEHALDFEVCEYELNADPEINWQRFRVGTVHGLWCHTKDSFRILALANNSPNNGHLNDVFQWFEYAAKKANINLIVMECMNVDFYKHLIGKRGFKELDSKCEDCIKVFNKKLYKKFIRSGGLKKQ